jgi:hypothetical protein
MVFPEEIESYKLGAEARARQNTLAFLDKYELERRGAEEMLARLCPLPCDIYYVSTVPAGLAGSKSDLDIILVPPESGTFESLSSMLFYGGRRVGAKIIPAATISRALEILRDATSSALLHSGGDAESLDSVIPLKWADLERLVNGISLTRGATYLPALNDVVAYAVARTFANYRQQRFASKLAGRAGIDAAVTGYLTGAVLSAMEALMAACGRVQATNSKWTLERWSRFKTATDNSGAADDRRIISAAWQALSLGTVREPANWLVAIDQLFDRMIGAVPAGKSHGLRLSSKAVSSAFLPGAVCIKAPGRTVVIPSRLMEQLPAIDGQDFAELSTPDAAMLLWLLQLELIGFADRGGSQ